MISLMIMIMLLQYVPAGSYQTPHQLVMVTEALDCGDLWGLIYETAPFKVGPKLMEWWR